MDRHLKLLAAVGMESVHQDIGDKLILARSSERPQIKSNTTISPGRSRDAESGV